MRAAVAALAEGLCVVPRVLLEGLLRRPAAPADRGAAALTPREAEVLGLLAEGLANKQIGAELGISDHTVKFHVASIYAKLGAGNRIEAVQAGLRLGLLSV
jgi:DNA-binding NarL/FixJ family response regulator